MTDDADDPLNLSASDLARICRLLQDDGGDISLDCHEILGARRETRLKFNALLAVDAWSLSVRGTGPGDRNFSGEIELFHWLASDEWELVSANF